MVGRGPHCDVQVDDPSVSRQHFWLSLSDSIELEDIGSANGTSIASELEPATPVDISTRVAVPFRRLSVGERVTLSLGDVIRAGSTILVVERRESPTMQVTLRPLKSEPNERSAELFSPPVLVNESMRQLYNVAAMAAQTDISVLILAETGVGKEVLAEFIHRRSLRAPRPFLRLNCAALSESLLESELFGHEAGSFTGAGRRREGRFELADGGTLFLDEVGEMSAAMQAKLLRVLQEGEFERVGGNETLRVDVRVVAATNRDLEAEVVAGRFRGDLALLGAAQAMEQAFERHASLRRPRPDPARLIPAAPAR